MTTPCTCPSGRGGSGLCREKRRAGLGDEEEGFSGEVERVRREGEVEEPEDSGRRALISGGRGTEGLAFISQGTVLIAVSLWASSKL